MSQAASRLSKIRRLAEVKGFSYTDALGLAVTLMAFGPGLLHYWKTSFSPDRTNDDSRQVTWPLLRYGDPPLFTSDPIADYYIDTHLPLGYQALMRALAAVIDAVPLSMMVGHISLIAALVFAFLIGRTLGGRIGGWVCAALLLATEELFSWTAGGLPRAVGTALILMALYGFLCDRPRSIALSAVLGALFWYPAAVAGGALYAAHRLSPHNLFVWRARYPFASRAIAVAVVGAITIACAAPKVIVQSQWGPVITNTSLVWQEAGEGGRLARRDQLGRVGPTETLIRGLKGSFINQESPWLSRPYFLRDLKGKLAIALSLALVCGLLLLSPSSPFARRLLGALAVSTGLYVAAIVVAPWLYAASRFIILFVPWIGIFAFVWLGREAAAWIARSIRPGFSLAFAQLAPAVLVILLLGGRPFEKGINVQIVPAERQTLNFISALPTSALIAGWPEGIAENIPLFSRRSVLLSWETHLPFHEVHLKSMRAKANAVFDAWFSVDEQPLRALASEYGVTHFVIDKERRANPSLTYFRPFDSYIRTKREALQGGARWIDAPAREAVAFENERYIVITLRPPA